MIKSMYTEASRESNVFDLSRVFLTNYVTDDPFEGVFPVDESQEEPVEKPEPKIVEEPVEKPKEEPVEETVSEPPVFDSQKTFVNYFIPLYEKALAERNLPTEYAKYLVGQIALESGWGKRPAGWAQNVVTYNYMGEKLPDTPANKDKGIVITTHEEDKNGNRYETKARFRTFNSINDMVNFHVWKFTQGRWVKHNIYDENDIPGFATRVHNAGYATGTKYAEYLNNRINTVFKILGAPRTEKPVIENGDVTSPGHIVISKETMTLKLYDTNGRVIYNFPIAVGKNFGNKQVEGDMKTPEGTFSVNRIDDSSLWTYDFKDGKGEIKGAYGPWFIRLNTGHNGIGIHGTHDPNSIGTRVTAGCIRLDNENLLKLKPLIKSGMRVIIEPDKLDLDADKSSNKYAYNEVIQKAKEFGIKFYVSSTLRPGARTKSGNPSRHAKGEAVDILAVDGNYNKLWDSMVTSGFKAWLESKGFRILREDIPWVRRLTGGTGPHFHIGKDSTIDTDGLFKHIKKDPRA